MGKARRKGLGRAKESLAGDCSAPLAAAQTNLHTFKILKHKARGRQFIVKRERGQGMLEKFAMLLRG